MDMMCITNAAELCDYYDECDIEQREAFLNSLDEQRDLLIDRLALLSIVKKNLVSPVVVDLGEEEERERGDRDGVIKVQVDLLKGEIKNVVDC